MSLEEFLEQTDYKESTKTSYRKAFKTFEALFKTDDFTKLFTENYKNVIDTLKVKYTTNYNYWSKVNVYCKHYNIPCEETPYGRPEKEVIKHDIISARKAISTIQNDFKAKVFLSLFTNKSRRAVRRDWATIQIKDRADPDAKGTYNTETGEFNFRELNKTCNSMKFFIEKELQEMLKEYISTLEGKYLYTYETKSEETDDARVASFTEYIGRISLKYLGKKMGMNMFRQMIVQGDRDEIMNSNMSNVEKTRELIKSAKGKDHSIEVEVLNYMESIDDKLNDTSSVAKLEVRISYLEKLVGELLFELKRRGLCNITQR